MTRVLQLQNVFVVKGVFFTKLEKDYSRYFFANGHTAQTCPRTCKGVLRCIQKADPVCGAADVNLAAVHYGNCGRAEAH